jgi:hypothetical protein
MTQVTCHELVTKPDKRPAGSHDPHMNKNTKLPVHLANLKIKRHARHGHYVMCPIENVQPGDSLDFGRFVLIEEHVRFVLIEEHVREEVVNTNTWRVELDSGNSYIETRGAYVRVWIDEAAAINATHE